MTMIRKNKVKCVLLIAALLGQTACDYQYQDERYERILDAEQEVHKELREKTDDSDEHWRLWEEYLISQGTTVRGLDDYKKKKENINRRIFFARALLGGSESQYWYSVSLIKGISRDGLAETVDDYLYWLERAGNQGVVEAQLSLGDWYGENRKDRTSKISDSASMLYKELEKFPYNRERAFYWYERASKLGSPRGFFEIAEAYRNGEGVELDQGKYWVNILEAAKLGFKPAQALVAQEYEQGVIVDKNIEEANKWYFEYVDKEIKGLSESETYFALGEAGLKGELLQDYFELLLASTVFDEGFIKIDSSMSKYKEEFENYVNLSEKAIVNIKKSIEWYLKSAELGNVEAQRFLGDWYLKESFGSVEENTFKKYFPVDYDESFKWYSMASDKGDIKSLYELAKMYSLGRGVEKNLQKAEAYFVKFAEATNNSEDQYELAERFGSGDGVVGNGKKYVEWLEVAQKNGSKKAGIRLADILYYGHEGVETDFQKSFELSQKYAVQGDIHSKHKVATHFMEGKGTLRNFEKGFNMALELANQGYLPPMNTVAKEYTRKALIARDEGKTSLSKENLINAYMWSNLIAKEDYANEYNRELRELLESVMNSEDISQAQSLSDAWQPGKALGELASDAEAGRERLKLIFNNGVYSVPVELNGAITLTFVLDSGAAEMSVSADVASTLIKTGTVSESDFLPGRVYQFADGTTAKSKRFNLKAVKIGNRTIENVACSISSSNNAPLLLGQSALEKLGSYHFDYDSRELVFDE